MNSQPRLSKPLLFLAKFAVYSAIFGGFHWLQTALFQTAIPFVSFGLTILIIILNRGKLTGWLQNAIDRGFYYTLYELKRSARSFNQDLNAALEFGQLRDSLQRFMDQTFQPDGYALYLYTNGSFEQLKVQNAAGSNGGKRVIPFPENPPDSDLMKHGVVLYPVADAWQRFPDYRPLIQDAMTTNRFTIFLPLCGRKQLIGFILFESSIQGFMMVPEVQDYVQELFQKTAKVVERAQIYSTIQRKSLEGQLLLEIVKKITATLNLQGVLESIVENLSRLVSYDAAAILLYDRQTHLILQSVARGFDNHSSREIIALKVDQGITGWVIQNKQGIVIPDVSKSANYFVAREETRSQITVPIISRDKAIGALVLESDELEHFTQADLELLNFFSGLTAVSIRNAQLYEDSLKKKRLESDLLVASRVQQALLPRRVPTITGLKMAVLNIPIRIVGGDLYDAFRIGSHRQAIVVGDVSGKGAPAAILMAVAYAGFKSIFKEIDPVATVVARLNNFLVETTTSGYFVTFFFGVLDLEKQSFTYCNAGHDTPILLHRDGTIEELDRGGIVLGFLADQEYVQTVLPVRSGDYLCFYTDGLTEMQNNKEEEFGKERLMTALRRNYGKTPREMKLNILDEIKAFGGNTEFQDDITLLIAYIQ